MAPLACFPFDVDSGGVEVCSIWASASAGGEDGDGEEFDEYGAAATEVQSVGTVGCGAVPDICHVGVTGEPDQRVDGGGGGEGVFDVGKVSAEFVGAGAELGGSSLERTADGHPDGLSR
jgi:hypothetical protein